MKAKRWSVWAVGVLGVLGVLGGVAGGVRLGVGPSAPPAALEATSAVVPTPWPGGPLRSKSARSTALIVDEETVAPTLRKTLGRLQHPSSEATFAADAGLQNP